MPSTQAQSTDKKQPWKDHWPPKADTKDGLKGHKGLGFKKGEVMVMDGNASSSGNPTASAWATRDAADEKES